MMRWWEDKKHIFVRERLRLNAEWKSNDFEFFVYKGLLWLSGTIYLPTKNGGVIKFPFELKFPENYPFSVPYIYPKGREKDWVGNHQFISTAFCLDIRDKTWNSSLSAVDIIKSLEKLLFATLDMIENKTDKLNVYEEKEPTQLDIIKNTIKCIVPFPLPLPEGLTIGDFIYFSPLEDGRIIISPILPVEKPDENYWMQILQNEYFNIWGFNFLISKKKGIWLKVSQNQLESIVFYKNLKDFKEFLINQDVVTNKNIERILQIDKVEHFILLSDFKADLYAKINYKANEVEYFGCYNSDLKVLKSRIPDLKKTTPINKKKVVVIGCGSSGSVIAEELVKSGISDLVLIDDDYLTVENVYRHLCSLEDVGLKKVRALKSRLKKINPIIEIECYETKIITISSSVSELIKSADVIVNATAESEEVINEFCWEHKIPSIHSKVYPLGYGGEVVRVIPDVTPCFECMNNKLSRILETQKGYSDTPDVKFINYNETDEGEIYPIPSLSIDAKYISLFAVKMTLEILYLNDLIILKSKPNIILWGNERRWIFKEEYECIKIDTTDFISYPNCFVCFGNKQIEEELGLTEQEILRIANDLVIKNEED